MENVLSTAVNVLVAESEQESRFFRTVEKVKFGRDWLKKGGQSRQISELSVQVRVASRFSGLGMLERPANSGTEI